MSSIFLSFKLFLFLFLFSLRALGFSSWLKLIIDKKKGKNLAEKGKFEANKYDTKSKIQDMIIR